jgi:hypothetical protein
MAIGEKKFSGGTFRENLREYSKFRASVDPVYRADLNKAMAERRRAAVEKAQAVVMVRVAVAA